VWMTIVWDDIGGMKVAHERFLAGERVEADVRTSILTSWQRCKALGLVPDQLEIPYQKDLDLETRLLDTAAPVLDRLASALSGTRVSVVLTDGQARVLQRRSSDPDLDRRLDAVRLAPGFTFAEPVAGTNGIGTALAGRRPCYVFGREHFADCMQPFACAGAPIRNPLSGRVEGVLDLTCFRDDADPAMLKVVREAAAAVERRLLESATERERDLLTAFLRDRNHIHSPAELPDDSSPVDLVPPTGEVIDRNDQAVLREKAAELISSPHQVIAQVRLSRGRSATLLRRSVTGPSGEAGVVVEASLPGWRQRRRITLTVPVPEPPARNPAPAPEARATRERIGSTMIGDRRTTNSPASGTAVAELAAPAPESATDGWLLLVGEPGVGRLALEARQRLELLYDASVRIGTTLDVTRTAEELTEVAVPRFADFAAVDMPDSVLLGEEPSGAHPELRRVALGSVQSDSALYAVGDPIHFMPGTPQARCLATGQPILEPVLADAPGWSAQDPLRTEEALDAGIHSLIAVPMRARGVILGEVSFFRSVRPGSFEDDDLCLAEELVGRAAVCVDNARRFTREHAMALALQRSLLPSGLPEQNAVEAAHRYLPAQAGVGGDWYDVIPLSGGRVALVVGDVVGHGVHAAATMGRLRTAVHNFSALDLPADDLLARLDDLVDRLDRDSAANGREGGGAIVGATCLYTVYDPASRRCTFARAGHPLPAIVLPDGTVEFPDLPAGPPLGLGGMPFETVDLELPEGSQVVLYTDGLVDYRGCDIDVGLARLRTVLASPGRPPEQTCAAVLDALLPAHPRDDVALLVARTRALDAGRIARWDIPADAAVVSRMRAAVTEQLDRWGLGELAFTTELVTSELITNAIRHATEPIQLRLLRDRALICEVSDGSSTSPRLRRAGTNDEGGRGLFLTAQFTARWGTRYTSTGKVIWTEQALPPDTATGPPEPERATSRSAP
jgi:serine phosphatase RsbU (regulator of sigma subunit)/anti-sigma regulatory factor (Ser/Thr protein kinase)